jgi:two-component sensor histidine kinase
VESAVKIGGLPIYVSAGITEDSVQRRWRADLRTSAVAAVMGVAVILLLTAIALRRCRREEEAGTALRDLNATLEGRVRERTLELEKTGERLSHLLEQKEALLREIVHRVKNSLQLACALLRLQGRASGNDAVAKQLDEAAIRITSIAQVHNRLYQSPDVRTVSVASYVAALCRDLETSLAANERQIAVECAVDPIDGSPDRVVLLGVIITELVTNAFKFAFAGRDSGRVRVEVRRRPEGGLSAVVADDGIGLAANAEPSGFGSHMVGGLLEQLDGAMTVQADEKGTRIELSLKSLGEPA